MLSFDRHYRAASLWYVYMTIRVYCTLATCMLVVKEEKKENPDPIPNSTNT